MNDTGAVSTGRRGFLTWLLGGSFGGLVASALYPVVRYLSPPDVPEASTNQVEAGLTSDPEFAEKGFKIVRFGSEPVLVLQAGDEDFRAFSATCTHLDCIVQYRKDRQAIWCYCHNGIYDLNGQNVGGPPPKPLSPFTVHLVDRDGGGRTIVVERT
ncbi:MAG TPA: ubiquinol-cytochrome c reductase iron-sulfur subunit [Thermoanaerobaculia bacterium]|nr:ubiquinol-cytochrome c reductase iron-sulfur subunit [Thermoanaerobaculia bacterium]